MLVVVVVVVVVRTEVLGVEKRAKSENTMGIVKADSRNLYIHESDDSVMQLDSEFEVK